MLLDELINADKVPENMDKIAAQQLQKEFGDKVLGFKIPLIFGYRVAEYIKARTPKGNYDARKMLWKKPK